MGIRATSPLAMMSKDMKRRREDSDVIEEKVGKCGMARCGGDSEGRVVNGTGRVSCIVSYILVLDTKQAGKR